MSEPGESPRLVQPFGRDTRQWQTVARPDFRSLAPHGRTARSGVGVSPASLKLCPGSTTELRWSRPVCCSLATPGLVESASWKTPGLCQLEIQ